MPELQGPDIYIAYLGLKPLHCPKSTVYMIREPDGECDVVRARRKATLVRGVGGCPLNLAACEGERLYRDARGGFAT